MNVKHGFLHIMFTKYVGKLRLAVNYQLGM